MVVTCVVYVLATLAAALDIGGTAKVNVLFVMATIAIVAAGASS